MRRVAAIVVNWNAREDTRECLASLARSSHRELETILVDNASADGSVEYLKGLFPAVLFVTNSTNEGFARASNAGMKLALDRGVDYVFLFNNDAVVDERAVERLVAAMEESSEVGMAGPKIFYFSRKNVIWSAGGEVDFWRGMTRHRGIRKEDSPAFSSPRDVDYLTGCALMATRELVQRVGMLDTSYRMYGEDADWCLRARKGGYRVAYVPEALAWHKVSLSSGGEFSPTKVYNKTVSNVRLFSRHARPYHWVTIPFFAAGYLVWLFLKGLAAGDLRLAGAVFRALGDVLRPARGKERSDTRPGR
ncbi:MAG: glycosyltransferase family 2 protein [Candidatus Eisenbacteria bacterium]|nr:glycosyltransferase family 2 protein [Candidatus Eisenbacteria bacterium]